MLYNEKLQALRERIGLTQEKAGKLINLDSGTYCHYEKEDLIMPLKHLNTLANYFNVSIDYLFGFTTLKQYENSKKEIDKIKSGARLKEFRKTNNLTQAKLAQKLNVARTIISKYEKGEFLIATHTLYTISKKYHISSDYLLGKINENQVI